MRGTDLVADLAQFDTLASHLDLSVLASYKYEFVTLALRAIVEAGAHESILRLFRAVEIAAGQDGALDKELAHGADGHQHAWVARIYYPGIATYRATDDLRTWPIGMKNRTATLAPFLGRGMACRLASQSYVTDAGHLGRVECTSYRRRQKHPGSRQPVDGRCKVVDPLVFG
ncbi:hypothetical protein HG530_011606 [Fusarium avenaceum]|nr:hypothetical protein HG530_011606 [Fusarium avenaceum]